MTKVESEIIEGMARALWVHAYMNWVEMPPNMSGTWDEIAPPTPAAAITAGRDLAKLISEVNDLSFVEFYLDENEHVAPRLWGAHVAKACLDGTPIDVRWPSAHRRRNAPTPGPPARPAPGPLPRPPGR